MIEAHSHFFIDVGGTSITQSGSQTFGPVLNEEQDKYRVTSLFTLNGDKLAYAVCKGSVLVVPEYNYSNIPASLTGRVNVVLKPYSQPLSGLDIKYVVYRGLKKDNFFDSNSHVIDAGANASDYINKVNADFDAFYTGSSPIPDFEAKFVGYFDNSVWPHAKSLVEVFSKNVEVDGQGNEPQGDAFELPIIDKGASIGNFTGSECGIDIVIDFGDYAPNDDSEFQFDLHYVRQSEAVIDVSDPALSSQEMLKIREKICQFIDVAAYYGNHCGNPLSQLSYSDGATVINKNGVQDNQQIYEDLVALFDTKNKEYIFIQSDRYRSYNYYGNYTFTDASTTESLLLGPDENNLVQTIYGTSQWPIIILENSWEVCELILGHAGTSEDIIWGQVSGIESKLEGFLFAESGDAFENRMRSTLPASKVTIAAVDHVIASFNLLVYYGNYLNYKTGDFLDADSNLTSYYADLNSEKEFWGLRESNLTTGAVEEYSAQIQYSTNRYKLSKHKYGDRPCGVSADTDSVVTHSIPGYDHAFFIRLPVFLMRAFSSTNVQLESNKVRLLSIETDNIFGWIESPYKLELNDFLDGDDAVIGITLKSIHEAVTTVRLLAITQAELALLKSCVTSGLTNPSIVARKVDEFKQQEADSEVIRKYVLDVVCEDTGGALVNCCESDPIIVYSSDEKVLYSKDFTLVFMQYRRVDDKTEPKVEIQE